MKVEWLPIAEADRERQLDYIAKRNLRAAVNMGDAIEAAVSRLSRHPHSGRLGRVNGTRELVIPRTPYIIAYRVEESAVVIARLLHSSQKWPTRIARSQ